MISQISNLKVKNRDSRSNSLLYQSGRKIEVMCLYDEDESEQPEMPSRMISLAAYPENLGERGRPVFITKESMDKVKQTILNKRESKNPVLRGQVKVTHDDTINTYDIMSHREMSTMSQQWGPQKGQIQKYHTRSLLSEPSVKVLNFPSSPFVERNKMKTAHASTRE